MPGLPRHHRRVPPRLPLGRWAVTDKNGLRVEVRTVDGVQTFLVTKGGRIVGRHLGDGRRDPRTIEELVAVGVDLASLA